MTDVGLRELRQHASDLVRRAEEGEEIAITVSGRLAARLVPATRQRWLRWDAIADVFSGPADPDWHDDVDALDQVVDNPWDR